MSNNSADFLSWAADPERALEEKFGILRLVEHVYQRYYRGADKIHPDWQAKLKFDEQRLYNPAYQPRIDEARLKLVAELLPGVEELHLEPIGEDRPLRDLSFLAFVPNVTSLRVRCFEREDLDGIQHLTNLRRLDVTSNDVEDYSALAACRELRHLKITTRHPWPVLRSLSELPHLEEFQWHGNGLAVADIPRLAALRVLHIESEFYCTDERRSIRDLHQLPDMPLLEHFWGGWFHRLDGIERFPRLRFLAIRGYFKSLAPLVGFTDLTHLRVTAPRLDEVASLAAMPSVAHFAVHSERPQDWGVLMESETLREVFHHGFDGDQPDLDTLRMLIPTWDDLLALPAPRDLDPIRFIVRGSTEEIGGADSETNGDYPDGPDGWNGNLAMRQSEKWWVKERVKTALRDAGYLKLQGVRLDVTPPDVFSLFSTAPSPWDRRRLSLQILKSEAIGRMPGIFQCVRLALSQMRHPWLIHVNVQPDPDADQWDESWKQEIPKTYAQEMVQLDRELEQKRQRKQVFLKDQHRMRLLQELGEDLDGFKPSPLPPSSDELDSEFETEPEDEEDDEVEDDTEMSGGTAFYDPEEAAKDESWLPPVDVGDPNSDWNDLSCMFILDETGVHMHVKNRGLEGIADLLDVVPERQ